MFENGVTMSHTKKAVGEKKFHSDIVNLSPVVIVKPLCALRCRRVLILSRLLKHVHILGNDCQWVHNVSLISTCINDRTLN